MRPEIKPVWIVWSQHDASIRRVPIAHPTREEARREAEALAKQFVGTEVHVLRTESVGRVEQPPVTFTEISVDGDGLPF